MRTTHAGREPALWDEVRPQIRAYPESIRESG
jgi:hypothetical protein